MLTSAPCSTTAVSPLVAGAGLRHVEPLRPRSITPARYHYSLPTHLHSSSSRTSKLNNLAVRSIGGGVDPVAVADSAASLQAAGISLPFPLPFDLPNDSNWQVWLVGTAATLLIPLATGKLGPLGKLFDKLDAAVDTAQEVAEMVDKLAERVEEVANEVENSLPAGSALKDALDYVENVADNTEMAAEYAESLLNKVEEVGDKVEEFMESAVAKKSVPTVLNHSQEAKVDI